MLPYSIPFEVLTPLDTEFVDMLTCVVVSLSCSVVLSGPWSCDSCSGEGFCFNSSAFLSLPWRLGIAVS